MTTSRQLIRLSICCAFGIIAVCLLYVFNVPTYRVDMTMTDSPLVMVGHVLNQTCSHKMSEIEWLQYMKYMTKLHKGKFSRKQPKVHSDALNNMRYTFSFIEGTAEGCLAVFMKEYLYDKLTNGSSHFRVEIDSKYSINMCSVDDYSDGTYHILCPVRERCSSIRIVLMYVNNTAYTDIDGSHALQKRIFKRLYCWERQDGFISHLFTSGHSTTPMKKTPSCFIKSQGFVSWVQDKFHNMRLAVDKCAVQGMPRSHFSVCTSNITRIVFIGGQSLQVYYRTILHHLKLTNDTQPFISKTNHNMDRFVYRYADTPKAISGEIEAAAKDAVLKTIIVYGGWSINGNILTKNSTAGNVKSIKYVIKKIKSVNVDIIWMPFVTMVRKTTGGKKSRTCCHGNDFAYLPINFKLMKEFGTVGVDTFDVAYYASRIQSCNTIYKSRSPCKETEMQIPYAYNHHAVIDAFLHYICSMSHGLPVRRYSKILTH